MRDGRVRGFIKRVICAIVAGEVRLRRMWRRARGKQRFELVGGCRRSGMCCESPAVQSDRLTWYFPTLRRLFLWWQREVNGFDLAATDRRTHTFIFRCTHFDPVTRSCDSYATRPFMCRDYPRELLTDAWPDFFPQCGYRPRRIEAAGARAAIEAADLTLEQKAELRRRLYIE